MNFNDFLQDWDKVYQAEAMSINIFKPEYTVNWSSAQKICFAKIFYHARGHFHDFLWYVGNHATDKETKEIVAKNIMEELNGSAKSHEQLYIEFAESLGADVNGEFVYETNYLPFIKDFNHNHIKWLHDHDADERFGAFAAYERLDNIDYLNLLELVKSLDVTRKGQIFFKIHSLVEHFSPSENKLNQIWQEDSKKIKDSFDFIAYNQLNMWRGLSDTIFNLV